MGQILWFTLTDSLPPFAQLAAPEEYDMGFDGRVKKRLEETKYPATTGEECANDMFGIGS